MKVFYKSWMFRFPPLSYYDGIVLGRYLFTRQPKELVSERLMRHERVHQEQMDRHGVFGFYVIYVWEYLKNLKTYREHWKAYYNIPFEREAYQREEITVSDSPTPSP